MENEERDVELDNVIPKLDIAEYQGHRLSDILASRLDRSNPGAILKRASTYTFESKAGEYRITVEVDVIDTEYQPRINIRSFGNALKSPIFIITCALFSTIACILALAATYAPSMLFTSFADNDAITLNNQYSVILDQCAAVMEHGKPNPRSNSAQYATCEKAIGQLDELCKEYALAICQDKKLEIYHVGK